jgi:activating signal cointegrator complex subunit 3
MATSSLAWQTELHAYFVVEKGTEYFDQKTNQYISWTPTELQRMISRSRRPRVDEKSVAVLLCEETRKDFISEFVKLPFPAESAMLPCVIDRLNPEIARCCVQSHADELSDREVRRRSDS